MKYTFERKSNNNWHWFKQFSKWIVQILCYGCQSARLPSAQSILLCVRGHSQMTSQHLISNSNLKSWQKLTRRQWRSCANIRAPTELDSPLTRARSIWGNSCIRRIFLAKMSITQKRLHFCCKMLSFQQLTHMLGFCRVKEQTNDDT